jgi:signal transduction histidine kinase
MRGAKLLRAGLSEAERASRALCGAGLSEDQIISLEEMCSDWLEPPETTPSLDREREIEDWLVSHQVDADHAGALADTAVTIDRLDELAGFVPGSALHAALDWIIAASVTRVTAVDIERAAGRIHDLVAAVKRFTAMDRASGSEAVDVAAGLRDTVAIMAPRAGAKGVNLTLDAEPNVPPVPAVVSDLNQVWTNLIENAIDAVGDSGRIEVTVRRELDRVVVRVIDDGPGMAPDVISRVFDPFFTTKAPGEGMGLGLEIARQLLRRYGGEIAADSEPGRTEFRVSLPAQAPDK